MMASKKRIGILTGGGECPGLNAVIRAVGKTVMHEHGATLIGIEDGFLGVVDLVEMKAIVWEGGELGARYRVEEIPQPDGAIAQVMVRRYPEVDVIGYLPDAPGWHVNVGMPGR